MPYSVILFRTILAILIGGLIGMERQSKHRPAGFRTHILVCLGSATVMMLSALLFEQYYEEYGILADPARMGAQVITGVGFLGAGTIIHSGPTVKGLTTAASLWAVAAIGLVVGAGFYALAITVAIANYLTLFIFDRISHRLEKSGNILEIMIDLVNKPKVLGTINLVFAKSNCKILDMEFFKEDTVVIDGANDVGEITIRIILKLEGDTVHHELLSAISNINGVHRVEKL